MVKRCYDIIISGVYRVKFFQYIDLTANLSVSIYLNALLHMRTLILSGKTVTLYLPIDQH